MHLVIVAGASEEDIMVMLQECSNDVNETTSRLIDSKQSASPFRSSGCCQGGSTAEEGCAVQTLSARC